MKYHINFNNEHTLSFEILDNPVAHAWVGIMQEKMSRDDFGQKIFRASFPMIWNSIWDKSSRYFNNLKIYYNRFVELGLDPEFSLKSNINDYSHQDTIDLSDAVDVMFRKVVEHNFYYNHNNNYEIKKTVKRIKCYKEELLDCMFNPDENYATIKIDNHGNEDVEITGAMRKDYWVETARPKLVIRLWPNFDLKSLDILEKRNDPRPLDGTDHMYYITSDHRICYYQNSLTQQQADNYMKKRRSDIIDFVAENNIDAIPGLLQNKNFVPPVIAHCINEEDFTEEQLEKMFHTASPITSEFEE